VSIERHIEEAPHIVDLYFMRLVVFGRNLLDNLLGFFEPVLKNEVVAERDLQFRLLLQPDDGGQ
jgi:hypothetical protein